MGSQVFILPSLDSISGFTLLFLTVTILAAWFATSGPRLSYFGIQLALAFYLINLQEFTIQTSLTVARDRVVGILLGLCMMWLVFDQLWSAPTAVEMRNMVISLFRLLAQLAREPVSNNLSVAMEQSYSLRETINSSFNQVRALADVLWFEFGPSRQQDLALRSRILGWQSQLRMLFITCVALLRYRLQLPGFELPEPVRLAEREFGECLARTLDTIADRLQDQAREGMESLEAAFARLRDSVRYSGPAEPQGTLTANMNAALALSERIKGLAVSLGKEISN
jgi:multidrug resistance protein MdtO